MKKSIPAPLCLPLAAALTATAVLTAVGCKKPSGPASDIPGNTVTSALSDTISSDTPETAYDPEHVVVIRSAEDLMAFHRAVNLDEYSFQGMTVIFLDNVDMNGYEWQPLRGEGLGGVTFDGQGHTVRGLRFPDYEYPTDSEPSNHEKGCGFIGVTTDDVTFRNLTLAHTSVRAYDHSVGNFIGAVQGGCARFENCASVGFTAEGWMDWFDRDPTQGGHAVASRMGGFVGYLGNDGQVDFSGCHVKDLTLDGFHNLAGFLGYDGTGTVTARQFSNCSVRGARLTFSYCLSEGYTADQPKKFVSVFFNATDWRDNLRACATFGNGFEDVVFYDWAEDCTAYTPTEFRSWAGEEETHG